MEKATLRPLPKHGKSWKILRRSLKQDRYDNWPVKIPMFFQHATMSRYPVDIPSGNSYAKLSCSMAKFSKSGYNLSIFHSCKSMMRIFIHFGGSPGPLAQRGLYAGDEEPRVSLFEQLGLGLRNRGPDFWRRLAKEIRGNTFSRSNFHFSWVAEYLVTVKFQHVLVQPSRHFASDPYCCGATLAQKPFHNRVPSSCRNLGEIPLVPRSLSCELCCEFL